MNRIFNAAIAVIANPFAGKYQEDLTELIEVGEELGHLLAERAVDALEVLVAPELVERVVATAELRVATVADVGVELLDRLVEHGAVEAQADPRLQALVAPQDLRGRRVGLILAGAVPVLWLMRPR